MGSILVAMPRDEDSRRLSDMLYSCGIMHDVEICQTASEILRKANDRDFGVVICTKSLKDMGFFELSGYLPRYYGMIVLTSDLGLETSSENTVKLLMPFKKRELISTVEMMCSQYVRLIRKKKSIPIKRSQAEQKIIDEAKMLLINRNGMSEEEAFRYIQKSSMDSGRNMVESAQMILMLNE